MRSTATHGGNRVRNRSGQNQRDRKETAAQ
jgi:hypothetical protein